MKIKIIFTILNFLYFHLFHRRELFSRRKIIQQKRPNSRAIVSYFFRAQFNSSVVNYTREREREFCETAKIDIAIVRAALSACSLHFFMIFESPMMAESLPALSPANFRFIVPDCCSWKEASSPSGRITRKTIWRIALKGSIHRLRRWRGCNYMHA